ncbi:AAA family ATPase [Leifsonia sp. SIMBA_070]|uniref:AAA family ATPase n=1 Tax=Leifsonia sp. SIMBA_070 TaxID=3085810 RepID=UPI00397BFDDC
MTRYIVGNGAIRDDLLTRDQLKDWVDGIDPLTGQRRGRNLESPVADLILDATINAPKSFSIAAMLDPDLAAAYEDLQDRLRDRIVKLWQTELNARRGKGGTIREDLARIEVVELRHERSRSLDPHKHRHLWLNVKVQGQDGKWSNIDTRVALRFQNVINAEGDLASRTDPAWIRTLAAKGFTLNDDGEIAQLQHLVRPLSKRSAQIEANKITRATWWKQRHPGQEPSHDVLSQIDRWAWAAGRPDKPGEVDEQEWEALMRQELLACDARLGRERRSVNAGGVAVGNLDMELIAATAVVDADARSTGTGGRFSEWDIRAGAIRAIAAAGLRAPRERLTEVIDTAIELASTHTVTLLSEPDIPAHVKRLMATNTATLKATLALRIEMLATPGSRLKEGAVLALAQLVEPARILDPGQVDGAAIIAGTARIVAISGAAGTGKTTMLKVAVAGLRRQGRNTIVVAPTKKASEVAGRETLSASSSLHQLLFDYGWRWATNEAGATEWTCLQVGAADPVTGRSYPGPRTRIRPQDRIVVDEAGMLDLETARGLVDVLERTGAAIALVGDEHQALPVGHSGAMALFWRRANYTVEMTESHRFKDPDWAALALRVRELRGPDTATDVASDLITTGHIIFADSDRAAMDKMVNGWFDANATHRTIALVTSTHAEAMAVSESVQARRIASGTLRTDVVAAGQSGQAILVGDVVQTRRNDGAVDVQNRQSWVVKSIGNGDIVLAAPGDASDLRRITASYAESHLHLAYATTVYGVQGETTDLSIVGPGVDSAGLYVGLTRGKENNTAIVVAASETSARAALTESLNRQVIEPTVEDSRAAALAELRSTARGHTAPTVSSPNSQAAAPLVIR